MKRLIIVSDWAGDSLTAVEFKSSVEGNLKDPSVINLGFVSSTPSTIHTGFLLQQTVVTEERYGRPHELVIFQNTDPRLERVSHADEARGAEFLIIKLTSGIVVCGPNAGYDFALLKSRVNQAFVYRDLDRGSQFRSRDNYARVCAHLMDNLDIEMDLEEVSADVIPDLKGGFIGHIDNYGNIKTTIMRDELKGKYEYGDEVRVKINGVSKTAKYVDNLFGGTLGELVIYPGSSGSPDDPYLEISVWRHFTEDSPTTGLHVFGNPRPGMDITIV